MSCGCDNRRMNGEIGRQRRLAKAWARMEGVTAALCRNADGTYGFTSAADAEGRQIVEYITPY